MPTERITHIQMTEKKQTVFLENRERLTVTGTGSILEFSDARVELETDLGNLAVKGKNLKIANISETEHTAEIRGEVTAMEYKKQNTGKSFLRSLFK